MGKGFKKIAIESMIFFCTRGRCVVAVGGHTFLGDFLLLKKSQGRVFNPNFRHARYCE